MIILFVGNVGTGKTTIAKEIAKRLNAEFVYFDALMPLVLDKEDLYHEGKAKVSLEEIFRVYDAMFDITKYLLSQNKIVVLESMFFLGERDKVKAIASKFNVPCKIFEIICDESVAKERLMERQKTNSQSPGTPIYNKFKDSFEHVTEDEGVRINSNKQVNEICDEILRHI